MNKKFFVSRTLTEKPIVSALFICLLSAIFSDFCSARSKNTIDNRYQLLLQVQRTRKEILDLDLKMVDEIHLAARELKSYFSRIKKFRFGKLSILPTSKQKSLEIAKFVSSHLPPNPYKQLIPKAAKERTFVSLDASISLNNLERYRTSPPKSWKNSPGTINIVHNGYDLVLIWGAASNGRPIKVKNQRAKIISIRIIH